jgi:hypothetical protein
VALAEASHVSVWDVRCGGGGGGCAMRLAGATPAPLHALAAAPPPGGAGPCMLAAVGAERTLVVYDARNSRPLRTLTGLMRKDVTSLAFAPADPRYLYAAGIDYEAICRRWDALPEAAQARAPGVPRARPTGWAFRGDARWAGLACAGDTVAAFCASGAVYAARVVPTYDVDAAEVAEAAPAVGGEAYDD